MLLERGNGHLTESRLITSRWVFGFKDSAVITDSFYFAADGSIENYSSDYEKTWKIENGLLNIFGTSGNCTLTFHVNVLIDNKLLLVSPHSADATGYMHVYLLEKEPRALAADAAFVERRPKKSLGKIRAAIITMVYNEAFFLPLWYRHYGSQVGYENLYVIDHGSTDNSVDPRYCNQIKIPREKFDDRTRTAMISSLHQSLLNYFDFVIYTDCDEFIVVRPSKFNSLLDYLQQQPHKTIRSVGINVLPHHPEMPPLDVDAPILLQRPFGFATHWYFKPLISSVPTIWSPGFHHCNTPATLDLDVWLFHLKLADFKHALDRQEELREIEWDNGKGTHLPTADQTERFLVDLQRDCQDKSFDDIDMNSVFYDGKNSPLRRIPIEFLTVF
jgi:hypothetical protein